MLASLPMRSGHVTVTAVASTRPKGILMVLTSLLNVLASSAHLPLTVGSRGKSSCTNVFRAASKTSASRTDSELGTQHIIKREADKHPTIIMNLIFQVLAFYRGEEVG